MRKLEQKLNEIIERLFDVRSRVEIVAEKEKFGDYSTNTAMMLAGRLKQNPREIAAKIIEEVTREIPGLKAEAVGPGFINFTVPARGVYDEISEAWHEKYGENESGKGKKAVVEYPSQNMAKPYSVGHLRPGTQGHAVAQILRANGWEVITDNHLGDYGTPFGIWVVGFLKLSSEDKLASGGVYELGRVYIEMKRLLKEEEVNGTSKLADEVQKWLLKLEQGDETAVMYNKKFSEISLGHIHDVMGRLGLRTDFELGEAFFAPRSKELVEKYLADGKFEKNKDGSVICKLDEFGIDVPMLMQKSNGAALYATTDLATLVYRMENWKPDKIVHAVGAEQKFYFEQLFAMGKKIGIEVDSFHLWFGLIDQMTEDGKREKMSSRKGVVLMEELLDEAEARAKAIVESAGGEGKKISEDDIRKIATGAIKFADFAADRKHGMLFDWKTIFALTGFSAAYVQYAGVRIGRILAEARDFELVDFGGYDFEAEKSLLKLIAEYPKLVAALGENLEMHKMAHFAYDLAVAINKYYEKTPVLKAEAKEKSARITVLRQVAQVLEHSLSILGIEIPGEM
ncbi:arginine--tRNA ligase [Candidatus Saccharibacteria bacterium]|nr:arginine--tRNA ligase [Candidatus Saccharibacteria bacterium]